MGQSYYHFTDLQEYQFDTKGEMTNLWPYQRPLPLLPFLVQKSFYEKVSENNCEYLDATNLFFQFYTKIKAQLFKFRLCYGIDK
jgi:hypothetical protein